MIYFLIQDTAIHLATNAGHSNTVEYLLNVGAKFIKNKEELTFMDLAILNNHTSVLLTIIAHYRYVNFCQIIINYNQKIQNYFYLDGKKL
jgi:hypothetical protein